MARKKIFKTGRVPKNPTYTPEELAVMRRMRIDREFPGFHDVLVYYGNRKTYSRLHAGYITYEYILEMMKEGKTFSIRDNAFTGPDVSQEVLAEIWFHGHKHDPNFRTYVLGYRSEK